MSQKNASKKLLQCAIQAGGNTKPNDFTEVSNDADRQWLENAVKNVTNAHDNLVARLKECLQVIEAYKQTTSISVDDVESVMEEISSLCEDIDLSCDFQKIGGFSFIIGCLDSSEKRIQFSAADILAVVAQNNEYCQDVLVDEHKILNVLLPMTLRQGDPMDDQVAIKAMFAVSCIIRQNAKGFKHFVELDGFAYLLNAIRSPVLKVQLKSTFLLRNLCKDNHESHSFLDNDDYIISLMKNLDVATQFDVIEFTLDILITVNCHHVGFREKCKNVGLQFKKAILKLDANVDITENRPEIAKYSKQLYKILNLQNCIE